MVAARKLYIMVTDVIKPGKEAVCEKIMKEKFIPAMRKQEPSFKWRTFFPIIGDKISKMILIAEINADHLVNYDEWIITSLEKVHGKEEATRYLKEWYESLDSSQYTAIVEDPGWSNFSS